MMNSFRSAQLIRDNLPQSGLAEMKRCQNGHPKTERSAFQFPHDIMQFAQRLQNVETSAIRELFKLLGKPGIISFAGGFPDPALFDVAGIAMASQAVLAENPGPVLQYGATEGFQPLREAISRFMADKGSRVAADGLIVTTGSQQALDLIGKTMISPGDKVIVEAPTFLATIQCFRLYGAHIIGAPDRRRRRRCRPA
jgi:2-aminoadipate transaminase